MPHGRAGGRNGGGTIMHAGSGRCIRVSGNARAVISYFYFYKYFYIESIE